MSEFDKLIRHYGHDVYIDLPGYDAAVSLICRECNVTLLSYSDPKGYVDKL